MNCVSPIRISTLEELRRFEGRGESKQARLARRRVIKSALQKLRSFEGRGESKQARLARRRVIRSGGTVVLPLREEVTP